MVKQILDASYYIMYMFKIDMLLVELVQFYIFQYFQTSCWDFWQLSLRQFYHNNVKGLIVATARKLQGIYQLDIVLKIACLICAYNTQSYSDEIL